MKLEFGTSPAGGFSKSILPAWLIAATVKAVNTHFAPNFSWNRSSDGGARFSHRPGLCIVNGGEI